MEKKGLITIFVVCLLIFAGILSIIYIQNINPTPNVKKIRLADDTNATADSVELLIESLNDFSFNFYNEIKSSEDGNIFFSPYSIFTALSMVYEGAGGNTATEMQNVLNILQNNPASLGSFGRIYNLLNKNQDNYTIGTANAFWANQDYTFLPEYLALLENFYMAEANKLDFSKNIEAAETINKWVEDQTNDKIKDLISPDILSVYTKLVLTNAIYFKGQWTIPFDPDSTYETDFNLSSEEKININMMKNDDSRFYYTENDDLQILELQYSGNDFSMLIILPRKDDITIAESSINSENITNWRNDFDRTEVIVEIPKFKIETKYTLNNLLQQMGIIDAFIPNIADFSGMDGTHSLFISKVLHKAYVEVNEEGTEAAAATGVVVEITAVPGETEIKEFKADHPFIFLIQHKDSGALLFMGRIMDPTS